MSSKVDLLDNGFVRVVDTMGDDSAIVQAARVSYGAGTKTPSDDKSLIRYLMRHQHWTPFEMPVMRFHVKCPIFVARQWVRHRTACLAGDVRVSFDLPSGPTKLRCRHDYLTIKQIYDRFQPTVNVRKDKQRNPFHKRDRIQAKLLRSYDEEFDSVYHTKIVDIWQTGERPVIKVVFSNGGILRATKDHLCLTHEGWLRLEDALRVGAKFQGLDRVAFEEAETFEPTEEQLASEIWQPVVGHEERYEVSSIGRVRTWGYSRPESGRRKTPKLKTLTKSPEGYWVVGLSCQGKTRTRFVHHLVLEAFDQAKPAGAETRHLNHCRTDNRLENLKWGSPAQNGFDRSISGCDQRLTPRYVSVVSAGDDGVEMTYDLEVSGPHHNFCAGGVIVHNSMNEVSARYSEIMDDFYIPDLDQIRYQSTNNKQGRAEPVDTDQAIGVVEGLAKEFQNTYEGYKELLEMGIAREMARAVLPVAAYTEFYWQANLRNVFHFLRLRMDPHAQYEIRVYAKAMLEMVRERFPAATEAFEDYGLNAISLSVEEQKALAAFLPFEADLVTTLEGRERKELVDKILKLRSLYDPDFADKAI